MERSQLTNPNVIDPRAVAPGQPPYAQPYAPPAAGAHDAPPPLPQDTQGNGSHADSGHAGGHDPDEVDLNVPKPHAGWVVAAVVVAVLALGALLATGLIPRQRATRELDADAAEVGSAPVLVNLVRPHRAAGAVSVSVPATLRPWQEVSIFARTTGYLKKYYVDISNDVKVGELMAEIDTPELDQELGQAQAALLQAQAGVNKANTDRDLAKTTMSRFTALLETQSVTQQNVDEKQAALNAAESAIESAKAAVASAEANLRRLTEMQKFQKIFAPFSGVVTGRAYDVGSLISANPTATDVKPMFKIAENDVLRAFVNVPQSAALQIKKQMEVKVTARERPGKTFVGVVMGTTNYLDPASRSLLTEVKLQNPREADGSFALLPGMYVMASFTITRDAPPLVVPGPSLVNNADGTRVAAVVDGRVHFKKVSIGQDFGSEVEIVEGLTGDEQIVANPGERVVEGVAVSTGSRAAEPAPAPAVKVTEATK